MQNCLFTLIILGLVSTATAKSYPGTLEKQEGLHADNPPYPASGLLGYGLSVRASQLRRPWSWALTWALRAMQLRPGHLDLPRPADRTAAAASARCAARNEGDRAHRRASVGPDDGADVGAEPSADPSAASGGKGSIDGSGFRELYGGGDGGACYDELTLGTTRDGPWRPGAAAGKIGDTQDGGGIGGGGSSSDGSATTTASAARSAGASVTAPTEPALRPLVIYIPPLTGTELQAKLSDKPSAPRWWCPRRTSSWFLLWVTLEALLPWEFPCYADNLRLVPGGAGGGARPPPGVAVRLGPTLEPPQGDPRVGDGLQPWSTLVRGLRQRGWTDDLLESHAYDWRLSPAEWSQPGGSFQQLRDLITSRLASSGGGRRVVLVGLSMGASYAAAFLSCPLVDSRWKAVHVERLVTLSGVWSGTPRSTWDVISGRLEGLEAVLDRTATRQLLRGIPALAWTFPVAPLPAAGGTGGAAGDQVVITNTALGRQYTAGQLGQALRDAGAPETEAFWEATRPFAGIAPPDVSTHCFYSYGLRCAVHVTYNRADFSDTQPAVLYDDGDVTVPHASLAACRDWAVQQAAPVRSYSYFGVVHGMLTTVPEALEDILDAVAGESHFR